MYRNTISLTLLFLLSCGRQGSMNKGGSLPDPTNSSQISGGDADIISSIRRESESLLPKRITPTDDTAPLLDDEEIDFRFPELIVQLEKLAQQQKESPDPAAQWAALQKLLTDCGEKVAKLSPKPHEPFMGAWKFRSCDWHWGEPDKAWGQGGVLSFRIPSQSQVQFSILGNTAFVGGTYSVTGGRATLNFVSDVDRGHQQGPWVGSVRGTSFAGTLNGNPYWTHHPTGTHSIPSTCDASTELVQSSNPIPVHYEAAIKTLGACYRAILPYVHGSLKEAFDKINGSR